MGGYILFIDLSRICLFFYMAKKNKFVPVSSADANTNQWFAYNVVYPNTAMGSNISI
jgi:hypothetical protein